VGFGVLRENTALPCSRIFAVCRKPRNTVKTFIAVLDSRKTHGKETITVTISKRHGKGAAHGTHNIIHTSKNYTQQKSNMAHGKEKTHSKEVDTWLSCLRVTEPLRRQDFAVCIRRDTRQNLKPRRWPLVARAVASRTNFSTGGEISRFCFAVCRGKYTRQIYSFIVCTINTHGKGTPLPCVL
jgi:hypothetical protein